MLPSMTMVAIRRPATYADLERLPANMVGELIDGVLYASPRPLPQHARATARALADLDSRFDLGDGGPGGWHFLIEPELRLDRAILVPDIAGWRRERMPEIPNVVPIELVPDWVCEVISPSTSRLDRGAKMDVYAAAGVPFLWIIDPANNTLETFRREPDGWKRGRTFADDEPVRAPPFEAVELSMTRWWLRSRPDQPR
jgi:Uma2 family endonuclease